MKRIGNNLQLVLASLFVIVAAQLNENSERSKPAEASKLVADLESIHQKISSRQEIPKRTESHIQGSEEILKTALLGITSLSDFSALNLPAPAKALLERIEADEFDRGNPFAIIDQPYPLALILSRKIESYQRDAYRSSHFQGQMGYDVIKYEITHPDKSVSFILAYKERTASEQVAIGVKDSRPIFSLFLVATDNGEYFMSSTEENKPSENRQLSKTEALARVSSRLESSTPLMTARDSY